MNTQDLWNSIDWKLCELKLAEQQNSLAIATTQGSSNEIVKVQNKIMRMFAARALAVRKVTTNRGENDRRGGRGKMVYSGEENGSSKMPKKSQPIQTTTRTKSLDTKARKNRKKASWDTDYV